MKKLRCSILGDSKRTLYSIYAITIIGIFYSLFPQYIGNYMRYAILIVIVVVGIWYQYFFRPVPKINLKIKDLIDEIKKNKFFSKYDGKYIKLSSTILDIEFSKRDIYITFEENDLFYIGGSVLIPSKKCINYLKDIKKEEVIVYGKLTKSNIKDVDIEDIIDDSRDFYNIEIIYLEL